MKGHCRRIGPASRRPGLRPGVPGVFPSASLLSPHPRAPLQSPHSCLVLWSQNLRPETEGRLLHIPLRVLPLRHVRASRGCPSNVQPPLLYIRLNAAVVCRRRSSNANTFPECPMCRPPFVSDSASWDDDNIGAQPGVPGIHGPVRRRHHAWLGARLQHILRFMGRRRLHKSALKRHAHSATRARCLGACSSTRPVAYCATRAPARHRGFWRGRH
jgi:hypothetical protein